MCFPPRSIFLGLHFIFHWTGLDQVPEHHGHPHAMNVTSPLNGTAALNATAGLLQAAALR